MSTPVVTPQADSTPALKIPERGTPEHLHWRKTGEFSLPAPKPAASEAAKEPETTEVPSGDVQTSEPAAASEAAKPQEPRKRSDANERKEQLNKEIRQLLEDRERIRRENEEIKTGKRVTPDSRPEAKKQAVPRPKPNDVDDAGKPKYPSWDAYEDALLDWKEAQILDKLEAKTTEKQKAAETQKQNEALIKDFQGQVEAAKKELPDYEEVAFSPELSKMIPRNSVIDLCILQTPLGAKTLYYLGKHPEKIGEILKLSPFQQSAELVKIQMSLEKPATPAKPPVSKAPPPVTEMGTRAVVPGDETERAVKAGDFRSYREAKNAEFLARRGKG